ncbi:diacylglycerol kinase family protein [Candidatus Microgenomates bacterium]|nr:diacylglycerol kinase family protein [Candidatus Microgenomates bacterium]
MIQTIRKHKISFKNAFNGLVWAFSTQPNFKIHFILALLAVLAGFYFKISFLEMTILILTIVFGFAVEMVNTSIEAMTDLITMRWSKQAKIAKDVAAGMMLITAIGAVIVAILILGPYILTSL